MQVLSIFTLQKKGSGMKNIKKKILPQYFKSVLNGTKTFELRKDKDDIQVGDCLDLFEWDGEKYTGRNVRCNVTYVLRNCPQYGLMDGYCIIGIEAVGEVVKFSKQGGSKMIKNGTESVWQQNVEDASKKDKAYAIFIAVITALVMFFPVMFLFIKHGF